jgi:hypothetical protein
MWKSRRALGLLTMSELMLLMFPALLGHRPGQFDQFGHFESDFLLDDFQERDIRCAHIPDIGDERPANASGSRVELADPT